jgi:hypothetical protein
MFKKILLCLLISFLFCQCYSKKWTTVRNKSDIPLEDSLLLVHANGHEIPLASARIHEDLISGYVVPSNYKTENSKVHIYLDSTFVLNNGISGTVTIPLNKVVSIKIKEPTLGSVKAGAFTGAIIGAGGMALFASLAEQSGETIANSVAKSAAVGAIVGVILGAGP